MFLPGFQHFKPPALLAASLALLFLAFSCSPSYFCQLTTWQHFIKNEILKIQKRGKRFKCFTCCQDLRNYKRVKCCPYSWPSLALFLPAIKTIIRDARFLKLFPWPLIAARNNKIHTRGLNAASLLISARVSAITRVRPLISAIKRF